MNPNVFCLANPPKFEDTADAPIIVVTNACVIFIRYFVIMSFYFRCTVQKQNKSLNFECGHA